MTGLSVPVHNPLIIYVLDHKMLPHFVVLTWKQMWGFLTTIRLLLRAIINGKLFFFLFFLTLWNVVTSSSPLLFWSCSTDFKILGKNPKPWTLILVEFKALVISPGGFRTNSHFAVFHWWHFSYTVSNTEYLWEKYKLYTCFENCFSHSRNPARTLRKVFCFYFHFSLCISKE